MTPRIERQGHGLLILCGSLQSSNDSGFHSFGHEGTVVRLNTTAAAILQLCDGTRTSREIVDCLSDSQGNRDFPVLIEEFLDAAVRRAWVVELGFGAGGDGSAYTPTRPLTGDGESADVRAR